MVPHTSMVGMRTLSPPIQYICGPRFLYLSSLCPLFKNQKIKRYKTTVRNCTVLVQKQKHERRYKKRELKNCDGAVPTRPSVRALRRHPAGRAGGARIAAVPDELIADVGDVDVSFGLVLPQANTVVLDQPPPPPGSYNTCSRLWQ